MELRPHKTKIVCTIGPASRERDVLEAMIEAGMSVARLNFSHGDFASHLETIERLRTCARRVSRRVAILADLPGPKIRVGSLEEEPIELEQGEEFILAGGEEFVGNNRRVWVSLADLARKVEIGDIIFLNDGFIQLEALSIDGSDVRCLVRVGGELRSHKGINLPGIELGISAVTDYDLEVIEFAVQNKIDAISVSFVEQPEDIRKARAAAESHGGKPFIVAKIERAGALDKFDAILDEADAIMVARGDLGVEIPIEEIAIKQKELIAAANIMGKPVITATQMLESMVRSRRPTRAEVTDVANAILDGTDCVMLSEESALGKHPVEAIAVMARIAAKTEPRRRHSAAREALDTIVAGSTSRVEDLISLSVDGTVRRLSPVAVVTPTDSGATARRVSRFRLPVWIVAFSRNESTCQELQFSYGVEPMLETEEPVSWADYVRKWLDRLSITRGLVVVTEGNPVWHPGGTNRMEIIDLG